MVRTYKKETHEIHYETDEAENYRKWFYKEGD